MPISIACPCGKYFRVIDEFAGRRGRCSGCGGAVDIPSIAMQASGGPKSAQQPPSRFVSSRSAIGEAADDLPEVIAVEEDTAYTVAQIDGDSSPPTRRKARKIKKSPKKQGFFSGFDFSMERKMAGAGVAGGLLMMVGAVVWFVCGIIYLERIFFYPPILFIAGIVATVRGAIGNSN